MGRGDGRLTWAKLPDLDDEKSVSFSDPSAVSTIFVKENYVFVGQMNGSVQIFKVKRNETSQKVESLDEVVDIAGTGNS